MLAIRVMSSLLFFSFSVLTSETSLPGNPLLWFSSKCDYLWRKKNNKLISIAYFTFHQGLSRNRSSVNMSFLLCLPQRSDATRHRFLFRLSWTALLAADAQSFFQKRKEELKGYFVFEMVFTFWSLSCRTGSQSVETAGDVKSELCHLSFIYFF